MNGAEPNSEVKPVAALLRIFDESSETIERTRQEIISGDRHEELFHQLRVAVKRLRSLSAVVERIDPEFDSRKRLRQLRPLFQEAGRVRDRQLHRKRIQELIDPAAVDPSRHPDGPEQEENFERFVKIAANSDTTSLVALRSRIEKTLAPWTDQALGGQMIHAWLGMLDDVADWERSADRTDLHRLRILSKLAWHALFLIRSMFPAVRIDPSAAAHLDHVQKMLGTWHDDEVALDHLESPGEAGPAADRARRDLEEAKKKLATSAMKEYRRLRNRILRSRRKLITLDRM